MEEIGMLNARVSSGAQKMHPLEPWRYHSR